MAGPNQKPFTELPIAPFSGWSTVGQIDGVLNVHDWGNLRQSAMLVDSMMRDDRINGVFNTRIGALLASPLTCTAAAETSKARDYALEIGGDETAPGLWSRIFPDSTLYATLKYGRMLGMTVGEILWTRDPKLGRFIPRIKQWHPQWLYWDWSTFKWMLIAYEGIIELPNIDENPHSDGHWFIYAPHGYQYGWLSAMVRALARHYIARGWNFRDWARYNEKHGLPILGMMMPAETNEQIKNMVLDAVANINNETVIPLPVNDDGSKKYDLKVIEAVARSFDSFKLWKQELDRDIAIAILGQELTTAVSHSGGNRALGQVQNEVRIDKRKEDAAIAGIVRDQVLHWYSIFNSLDPEITPLPVYQVEPPEDETAAGNAYKSLGDGIAALNTAAPGMIDVRGILEQEGVLVLSDEEIELNKAKKLEEEQQRMELMGPPPGPGGAGGAGGAPGAPGGRGQLPPARAGAGRQQQLTAAGGLAPVKHYEFQGLPIAVENLAGSTRVWHEKQADGTDRIGSTKLHHDYGFIEGVSGADKDELDVFIGPDESAKEVYIVRQQRKDDPTQYDEDKVFMGFPSADAAKAAYVANRDDGDRCYGGHSAMSLDRFKEKIARRPAKSVSPIRLTALDGVATEALVALVQRVAKPSAKRIDPVRARLEARAIGMAARALAPDLRGLTAVINEAKDFKDLRAKVVAYYTDKMTPDKLADVVYRTQMLGHLAGRLSAQH